MITTEAKNGTFVQLAEDLQKNNEAAINAIAEHNSAASPVSNKTGVAKRLANHTSAAMAGSPGLKAVKKRRVYEVGISQNVSNGEAVVNILISFGAVYSPVYAPYSVASLQALNVQARSYLNEVRDTKQSKSEAINHRAAIYTAFHPLITRAFNELEACGAPKGTIKDAKHCLSKTRGKRIINIDPNETDVNHISACQTSFNQQVDHFSDFLAILAGCPEYDSNQPELKLIALQDFRDSMITCNSDASICYANSGTSLITRNEFFNAENTGFVDTYAGVKRAVKATFGGNSAQYFQVAHFAFKKIRD